MSKTNTFRHARKRRRFWRLFPAVALTMLVLAAVVTGVIYFAGNKTPAPIGGTSSLNGTDTSAITTTTTTLPQMSEEVSSQLTNSLSAQSALLYDATNDRILFSKNADTPCSPASLTKIMTAAVAAKYAAGDNYVIGREVYLTDPQASSAYLKLGMELTLPQMLQALLLPSGGDAAYSLAVHTAQRLYPEENLSNFDAATRFCDLMNKELEAIGAAQTCFYNPDGMYHTFHLTTAEDMLKVLQFAWQFDAVREALCTPRTAFTTVDGTELSYTNTNRLLNSNYPAYYYTHAKGGKTGFTDEAGYCLASVAEKDGATLISLVFGCSDENLRFTESIMLFEAGFTLTR